MTPERQRIKIAESCGWTCCGQVPGLHPHGLAPWLKVSDYTSKQVLNHEVPIDALPDYLGNLNAIHPAVMSIDPNMRNKYVNALYDITTNEENDCNPVDSDFAFCNATAAQRAEAFLRTLNRWEES